jgi:RNase H-like domain found in reverse transcriptase
MIPGSFLTRQRSICCTSNWFCKPISCTILGSALRKAPSSRKASKFWEYSKLFCHADSLKNIHFKETYALVQAFSHFRPYLLNTTQTVVVFTDARSLIWVSRNREYNFACNGLVNKLAKIQLEIPHKIFSVTSEVNYLADLFSRSYSTSRFLDKDLLSLSKVQANKIPPLPNPCLLEEAALYQYFAQPLQTEASDIFPRKRSEIATPKPIKSLYKIFGDCTPEQKYLSALRLLQGWNDSAISAENESKASLELNALSILEKKDKPLFKKFCDKVVTEAVEKTMQELYQNLDRELAKRIRATLLENYPSNSWHRANRPGAFSKLSLQKTCEFKNLKKICIPRKMYKLPFVFG